MKKRAPKWLAMVDEKKVGIRRVLLNWYRKKARDLPWRRSKDPYSIWVSEIMLQQTRVEAVIPYFNRFMDAFPRVEDLAAAKQDHLMKLWEGLGYYNRAGNLLKGAVYIVKELEGQVPQTVEEWLKVPGVGQYTAGAVTSIAFDRPVPILDGNVKRVLSRLFAVKRNIEDTKTKEACWLAAEKLVPQKHAGDFNQALMELGATICLPSQPKCGRCPASTYCAGFASGHPTNYPVKKKKAKVPHVQVVAAVIKKNGRFMLGKRPEGKLLAGLWEFPGGKVEPGETNEAALIRELQEELGIAVAVSGKLAEVNHAYSHYRVTLHFYVCHIIKGKPKTLYHSELKWIPKSRLDEFALPKANLKMLHLLP